MNRTALVMALESARAAVEAALAMLTETSDADAATPACEHTSRVDIGSFADTGPHWVCRDCGHEQGGTDAR